MSGGLLHQAPGGMGSVVVVVVVVVGEVMVVVEVRVEVERRMQGPPA